MTLDTEEPAPPKKNDLADAHTQGREGLIRAFALSLLLSLPRAVLILARFDRGLLSVDGLAAQVALQAFLESFLVTLPVGFLVIHFASRFWRPGRRWMSAALVLLVFLLGFQFLTFQFPASALFDPGWQTRSAVFAQVGLGVCALGAALITFPGFRLPLLALLGFVGFGLLSGSALFYLTSHRPSAAWPEKPSFILISLDTLRPDRLESYGYTRPTSPNIDKFFAESWKFDRAFAPQPFTLTSHATMLTGLEPSAHGVSQEHSLSSNVPTLASEMRAAGYATMAIVDGCTFMDQRFGYARGFEIYRQVVQNAESKIEQVDELLTAVGDRPFLLFLHCYDSHSDFHQLPYEANPNHMDQLVRDYTGEFRGCSPDGSSCASRYLQELNQRGGVLPAEAAAWISDCYDAGIATMDEDMGELFRILEESGRLENTVVLLTSDHGEEFYEHGQSLHGQHFVENLQVPLLVRTPDSDARTVQTLTGLIDLAPSILEMAGLEPTMSGDHPSEARSFLPWVQNEASDENPLLEQRKYLVSESGESVRGIRTGSTALVRSVRGWQLFDMESDPKQLRDLSELEEYSELRAELNGYLKESEERMRNRIAGRGTDQNRTSINEAEREQLEALGYLGDDETVQ